MPIRQTDSFHIPDPFDHKQRDPDGAVPISVGAGHTGVSSYVNYMRIKEEYKNLLFTFRKPAP
jgi:hypothetical protein